MQTILRHIVRLIPALLFIWMPTACSTNADPVAEPAMESSADNGTVMLIVNTGIIGSTRSDASNAWLENEMMKTLRIVILHADGTVEHNRFYSFESPQEEKKILLKVRPKEGKKIFLFANEQSVASAEGVIGVPRTLTAFFESYSEGRSGFADAVNALYFAPDYSDGKPIPMSSIYEIAVPEKGTVEKTFYVVRVATKFTVNFKNWRNEKVTVNQFTIANHADKNFLMAHVNDSERNLQLFGEGNTWIDWLKKVSDTSSKDDNYATTEAASWLKDYELPSQADKTKTYTHGRITIGSPIININNPESSKPGVAENIPVFYLPESMNLKTGATDGEQEYTMTINIAGTDEPFVCKLPNLKALFRSTHVMVEVTMYNQTSINISVKNWRTLNYEYEY